MPDAATVRDFFRRHHAVPANDAGPLYAEGTPEAVVGHARAALDAWDKHPDARGELLPDLKDLRAETRRRMLALPAGSSWRTRWAGLWYAITERIGAGE